MPGLEQDLTNKAESVERVYGLYLGKRFVVNRRYQRKLVWSIEEKRAFIDSLLKGYPVPLILLAEGVHDAEPRYEIIDGMQRLNAIVSFIDGEFDLGGAFFDLETMAQTKQLRDIGVLVQKLPMLPRDQCIEIVRYSLPLTVYQATGEGLVDEVFRRINAYGKHLSKQDLRVAGVSSGVAQLVRQLASRIRGDVSVSDKLYLNAMKDISITSRELDYGINADTIFWVEQGILPREYLRQSRDEEQIADMLGYILLSPKPSSHSDVIDELFGFSPDGSPSPKRDEIEAAIKKIGPDQITKGFIAAHAAIRKILEKAPRGFGALILSDPPPRVPRYYQAVFLAVHEMLVSDGLVLKDEAKAARLLDGAGKHIDVGGGGGRLTAETREANVNAIKGILRPAFVKRAAADPVLSSWTVELENLLMQSHTEQSLYDFKQGFMRLDATKSIDDAVYDKVFLTLAAMANHGPGYSGYVIVGIADNAKSAQRAKDLFGIAPTKYNRFLITGIEHEATGAKGLDGYYQAALQKLAAAPLPQWAKDQISRDSRLVSYFDKSLLVFRVDAGAEPCAYDKKFYERRGPNVAEIPPDQLGPLFKRFFGAR